jgi:tetratricopeptide (TPR) repeat protein
LRPLAEQAPSAASVRELLGLTYYRLSNWKLAIRELEAFATLTTSTEQHPILADCYRALGRWKRVDELWEELREASPAADLVAEGRIVAAGSLADRGELAKAIALLEKAKTRPRRPKPHHLRMAYALADLRERAGDVAGARDMFGWIGAQDPQFADAAERAAALT